MHLRESKILSQRIQSGKAEPASEFEKELAQKIIRKYEQKYGTKKARVIAGRKFRKADRRTN